MGAEVLDKNDLREMLSPIMDELRILRRQVETLTHRPDETVLSDQEAATRLGISVSTLRRKKKKEEIPSILTTKGRMVRVCDLPLKS